MADVAGYSRLMEADEAGTVAALNKYRSEILAPLVAKHKGRIVKLMGDGALLEFTSAVNSIRCAVELQQALAAANEHVPERIRIMLRIGINLGDVVVEGDDIYGDGVNITARLEAMAEPGGICISDSLYRQVHGKVDFHFDDLGEQAFKNIAGLVKVYRLRQTDAPAPAQTRSVLSLPDRPSIAVLPFNNMSGDPEQDYFADGIVEDIITALSRIRWLFVIARNSSFAYKGRTVDIKQIGRELGVRYVLEGSVRKSGNRVRITGQLIDGSTAAHLWADRFDGQLEDVFDFQDRITGKVVGAISPKLEEAELERSRRKPTESLDAYDHYLRGMANVHLWTEQGNCDALSHFYKAIELDPKFAAAYGMAARCYSQRKALGAMTDTAHDVAEAARLAKRAVEFGPDDALALAAAGIARAFVVGDYAEGDALTELALTHNSNLASAWWFSGWTKLWLGEFETAIERVAQAMRLSPNDPQGFIMQDAIVSAHFCLGRYAEALQWATKVLRARAWPQTECMAAASSAQIGRLTEARQHVTELLRVNPGLRISDLREAFPELRRPQDFARLAEGLRKAGLPD
jgi:adenylate cyclase